MWSDDGAEQHQATSMACVWTVSGNVTQKSGRGKGKNGVPSAGYEACV